MRANSTSLRLVLIAVVGAILVPLRALAEDGYDLWLRYRTIATLEYPALDANVRELVAISGSQVLTAAQTELLRGLSGLSGRPIPLVGTPTQPGAVLIGTPSTSSVIADGRSDSNALGLKDS